MTGAKSKTGKVFLMSGAIGIIVGAAVSMYGRFSGYPVTVTSGFASGAGIAAALLVFDMKLGVNEATRKVEDAEKRHMRLTLKIQMI